MNKIANECFCRGQLVAKYAKTYEAILQERVQQIRDSAEADEPGEIIDRTASSCSSDVSFIDRSCCVRVYEIEKGGFVVHQCIQIFLSSVNIQT